MSDVGSDHTPLTEEERDEELRLLKEGFPGSYYTYPLGRALLDLDAAKKQVDRLVEQRGHDVNNLTAQAERIAELEATIAKWEAKWRGHEIMTALLHDLTIIAEKREQRSAERLDLLRQSVEKFRTICIADSVHKASDCTCTYCVLTKAIDAHIAEADAKESDDE